MKKAMIAAAVMSALAATAHAQSQETKKGVQRDVCSALILHSMATSNYRLSCLNLNEISIDDLLRAGYRVTATMTLPGSDRYESYISLFVEKAQ
ncbi:MAG: hypothetical protein ABWU16_09015 [Halothiobacillaceae bacterium]